MATTFTLTARLLFPDTDGHERQHVTITPNARVRDKAGNRVHFGPRSYRLGSTGALSVQLVAQGVDPDIPADALQYTVSMGEHFEPITFTAPAAGTTLDLADVIPAVRVDRLGLPPETFLDELHATVDLVDEVEARMTAVELARPSTGFVALGDSISTSADMGAGGAGFGGAWPHMTAAVSQQRINFLGNGAVAGQNSTQIAARVPDILALAPDIVTILAGTNDLSQNVATDVWQENIRYMATTLRGAGCRVILCTIPPRGNTLYLTKQNQWNAWLRQYAADHAFELIDFWALLVDPATNTFKAGYDADGVHPHQSAHLVMAQHVAQRIATKPYSPALQQRAESDPRNLLTNPTLTSGAVEGANTTPGYWIRAGSADSTWVEKAVTAPGFDGFAWEFTNPGATTPNTFREFRSYSVTANTDTFAPGDRLIVTARVQVTGSAGVAPSDIAGLRLRINWMDGTSFRPVAALALDTPGVVLFWFPVTVPADVTTIQLTTVAGPIPTGATFTARVGNFGVFNATRAEAV